MAGAVNDDRALSHGGVERHQRGYAAERDHLEHPGSRRGHHRCPTVIPMSPGPLATRAASGIPEFDALLDKAKAKAPARSLVSIDDVGVATAFLAHDAARLITGERSISMAGTTSSTRGARAFARSRIQSLISPICCSGSSGGGTCMLRQYLVGAAASVCNIVIHALVMVVVIKVTRIADELATSRQTLRSAFRWSG